jgi:molybdopterin-guanine dinucleotide biosynthesis protein A
MTQGILVSGIILCGGKGRRMEGKDKGLQRYNGKPLLAHVIDKLKPQVDDIVISANRNIDQYTDFGFPVCPDNTSTFDGPLAGIAASIPACKHDWIIVAPCDMPDLPADLVTLMAAHLTDARLITISSHNRIQLIFLIHRSLLDSIALHLESGENKVMNWVSSQNSITIDLTHTQAFKNINTLDQLKM